MIVSGERWCELWIIIINKIYFRKNKKKFIRNGDDTTFTKKYINVNQIFLTRHSIQLTKDERELTFLLLGSGSGGDGDWGGGSASSYRHGAQLLAACKRREKIKKKPRRERVSIFGLRFGSDGKDLIIVSRTKDGYV